MSSKRRAINLVSLLFLLSSISKSLLIIIIVIIIISTVLSVTFEVGVSLLLAPAGADKSTRLSSGRSRVLLKALLVVVLVAVQKQ